VVHGSSFFDFGEGENRLPDRTLAARGLEENGDQIDYDIMRRGEPSSAKFEIPMYLGIFFWRQAAL
jgi:hypothetical protein